MTFGNSAYPYEIVCPTNATKKCVRWSSSNTEVVSVNSTSGLIYAQKADTARVYSTALDGSGKEGYSTVNKNNSLYVIISAALFERGEKCFLKVERQPTAV